jgi:hypothetical protein
MFFNLFSLRSIKECSIKRKDLLQREEKIDANINECKLNCERVVTNYLLAYRDFNRKLTSEMLDTSIIHYADVYTDHLNKLKKATEGLETFKNCNEFCVVRIPNSMDALRSLR